LASNEVQISLSHRKIESNGVLAAARRLGVTLIAYTPLKSGILTGAFHADPSRVRTLSPLRRRLAGLNEQYLERTRPVIDELRAVAQAYDVTPGQVALSWLVNFYDCLMKHSKPGELNTQDILAADAAWRARRSRGQAGEANEAKRIGQALQNLLVEHIAAGWATSRTRMPPVTEAPLLDGAHRVQPA
jgi:hypothetical protein